MSEPTVPPSPPPPPSAPPPPPPGGAPPAGGVSQNRGLMLVLSYLGILALVPLLLEKEDREVQWHAKHGLVLMVAEFIVAVGIMILGFALSFVDFGCSGCVLWWIFIIAVMILHITCIVKAINGGRLIVPGVSHYADRF